VDSNRDSRLQSSERVSNSRAAGYVDRPNWVRESPVGQVSLRARGSELFSAVKVNFIIGADGMAHNIEIVNSPGYGLD